jgi:23S rRNA pseudouridine1911/1915/1917 synthase
MILPPPLKNAHAAEFAILGRGDPRCSEQGGQDAQNAYSHNHSPSRESAGNASFVEFIGFLQHSGKAGPRPFALDCPPPNGSCRRDKEGKLGAMTEPLAVLYEDNHCLLVAKPGGLLTQGVPPGIPTLEAMAKDYLKEKYKKQGRVYLGIPHRLDRPVSGVVLFARSTKSAQRLAEQFRDRHVRKIYVAAVEGDVQPAEGVWEDWLLKLKDESRTVRVGADTSGARRARLRYRPLQSIPNGSLLEIEPETGRMHQIRVQAAGRGWPVRGDFLYGARLAFGPSAELPRDRVIALHARSLTFLHPIKYEPITVSAPFPADWNELGIEAPMP